MRTLPLWRHIRAMDVTLSLDDLLTLPLETLEAFETLTWAHEKIAEELRKPENNTAPAE